MKVGDEIVKQPIFLKIAEETEDEFWKCLMMNFAYEKCPYGVVMEEPYVFCRFKGNEFNFNFERVDDPHEAFITLKHYLQTNLHIESTRDHFEKYTHMSSWMCYRGVEWVDIKKKSIKELLLQNYVIQQKQHHQLSLRQCKKLLSTLLIGIQFKRISNHDIQYNPTEMVIEHIDGVTFEESKVIVPNVVEHTKLEIESSISQSKVNLWEAWDKYILADGV